MPAPATSTILLIGCGWLGLPLACTLAAAGHRVLGTSTSPDKLPRIGATGAQAHLLRLTPDPDPAATAHLASFVEQADAVVLNIPPPRAAPPGTYAALLRPVAAAVAAAGGRAVLFVSSTGVYADAPRPMYETDAVASATAESVLLQAESLFPPAAGHMVLRLGGLFGPGRPPGRFLAGRTGLPQGNAPVNLLHLTDAIGVVSSVLQQNAWGHTLNVCAATHPLRRDFYPAAARHLQLAEPVFLPEVGLTGKTVASDLLRRTVRYDFRHDDLLAALNQ